MVQVVLSLLKDAVVSNQARGQLLAEGLHVPVEHTKGSESPARALKGEGGRARGRPRETAVGAEQRRPAGPGELPAWEPTEGA